MDEYKFTNDKDVTIKGNTDKRGKDHISFYDSDPQINPDHSSIHINWNSKTGEGEIVDTTTGDKVTTDTKCYLTTACMRHFKGGFNDNCEELNILRWFRDNYIPKEDVMHYYEIAPAIVEELENMNNNHILYSYLYNNVILPCVEAIKRNEYEFAYNRYKISVKALERILDINEKKLVKKI